MKVTLLSMEPKMPLQCDFDIHSVDSREAIAFSLFRFFFFFLINVAWLYLIMNTVSLAIQ